MGMSPMKRIAKVGRGYLIGTALAGGVYIFIPGGTNNVANSITNPPASSIPPAPKPSSPPEVAAAHKAIGKSEYGFIFSQALVWGPTVRESVVRRFIGAAEGNLGADGS